MNFVRLITIFIAIAVFGASAQTAATPKAASAKAAASAPAPTGDLVDINHATAAELKALPGIGDAYSNAIVKRRPYKNKTQLKSMGVIPSAAYEKIKDKIVAKQ